MNPAASAANRIPVPAADRKLKLKIAVSGVGVATTGGTRDESVQTPDRNFRRRNSIEKAFRLRQAPDEDDYAEDDPGKPGSEHCRFSICDCRLLCVRSLTVREGMVHNEHLCLLSEFFRVRGPP